MRHTITVIGYLFCFLGCISASQNLNVAYGLLRNKSTDNPLNPEKPHTHILYLTHNVLSQLKQQMQQICARRVVAYGINRLCLDPVLNELSLPGQQSLFGYVRANNVRLDKGSRDCLVAEFREIYRYHLACQQSLELQREQYRLQEEKKLCSLRSWDKALNSIAGGNFQDVGLASWDSHDFSQLNHGVRAGRNFSGFRTDKEVEALREENEEFEVLRRKIDEVCRSY